MTGALLGEPGGSQARRSPGRLSAVLTDTARAAGPPLLFGLRLWASVCLALYIAYWLELDDTYWAGTSAAIMCQPHLGASLRKGWYRMIGTLVGAVAIVALTACFPQQRAAFLVALALWGAACAFGATLLRNFASYSAALAGFTAAIIASDQLGATGGLNGRAFMLAVTRVSEICIGIVSAGVVLAGSDFGGAPRRLAALFAAVSAEVTGQFTNTLTRAGPDLPETRRVRRDLIRQTIGLDPVIDEAFGESSRLRYHSAVLQRAVDGLLAALAGWRTVAAHLARLPNDKAQREADTILRSFPQELRSAAGHGELDRWMADATRLRQTCQVAVGTLVSAPVRTPSLRLLADKTATVLAGISQALDSIALLVADPDRPPLRGRGVRPRVPDWLPSFVNAGRAFVAIGVVALFWILTAWPSGALAITWTAIPVILFSPRADQAYAVTTSFIVGCVLAAVFAAIIAFAVLPGLATFAGFAIAMGLYLIPVGALLARSRQSGILVAMAGNFVPFLAPANQMVYDTTRFYNAALAILAGSSAAALSFRLLPPLSPALRTRRLLALTLRDLRCLATGPVPESADDWERRAYGRLSVLPDEAGRLQRAQLLVALAMGIEVVHLRRAGRHLGVDSEVGAAFEALAEGKSAIAAARLDQLDARLVSRSDSGSETSLALRARGSILAIGEALADHASYFNAGAPE